MTKDHERVAEELATAHRRECTERYRRRAESNMLYVHSVAEDDAKLVSRIAAALAAEGARADREGWARGRLQTMGGAHSLDYTPPESPAQSGSGKEREGE